MKPTLSVLYVAASEENCLCPLREFITSECGLTTLHYSHASVLSSNVRRRRHSIGSRIPINFHATPCFPLNQL